MSAPLRGRSILEAEAWWQKIVAFVNAEGSVDLFERSYDDETLVAGYVRSPVDVVPRRKAREVRAVMLLPAVGVAAILSILVACVSLSGGLA